MIYEFGDRLKQLRLAKKFSQEQVAKRLGLSRSVVSGYEHNTHQPPINVLVKLAALYGVSTDFILGIEKKTIGLRNVTPAQEAIIEEINRLMLELLDPTNG